MIATIAEMYSGRFVRSIVSSAIKKTIPRLSFCFSGFSDSVSISWCARCWRGTARGRQGCSRRRSPTRSRTWTSRRRTGSACSPTTCRKSSAARAWRRSSRRRVRCSGWWAPSCATRPRHGPARATSRREGWPRCTTRRFGKVPRAVMVGPSW